MKIIKYLVITTADIKVVINRVIEKCTTDVIK
jgi:hypothetical protein